MLLLAMTTFLKAVKRSLMQQGILFGFNPSAPDNLI